GSAWSAAGNLAEPWLSIASDCWPASWHLAESGASRSGASRSAPVLVPGTGFPDQPDCSRWPTERGMAWAWTAANGESSDCRRRLHRWLASVFWLGLDSHRWSTASGEWLSPRSRSAV